jgi:hypothetical protein
MTTREKIIVGLMLLVVAYGAFELFLAPKTGGVPLQKSAEGLKSLNAFIAKVAAANQKAGLSQTDAHIIKMAEADWKQDPMLDVPKKSVPEPLAPVKKPKPAPKLDLVYTGYMDMGGKSLAIINGMEYETGDIIEPDALLIRRIYPNKIEVVATESGGTVFTIPLTETD